MKGKVWGAANTGLILGGSSPCKCLQAPFQVASERAQTLVTTQPGLIAHNLGAGHVTATVHAFRRQLLLQCVGKALNCTFDLHQGSHRVSPYEANYF